MLAAPPLAEATGAGWVVVLLCGAGVIIVGADLVAGGADLVAGGAVVVVARVVELRVAGGADVVVVVGVDVVVADVVLVAVVGLLASAVAPSDWHAVSAVAASAAAVMLIGSSRRCMAFPLFEVCLAPPNAKTPSTTAGLVTECHDQVTAGFGEHLVDGVKGRQITRRA